MAKIVKQVEVSKEFSELLDALVAIAAATKAALADGFQPGQDIPVVVAAAWAKLPEAVAGIDKIGAEIALEKVAALKAASLAADDLVALFLPAQAAA